MNIPGRFPAIPGGARNSGNSKQSQDAVDSVLEAVELLVDSLSSISDSLGIMALYYERKGRGEGLLADADFAGGTPDEKPKP